MSAWVIHEEFYPLSHYVSLCGGRALPKEHHGASFSPVASSGGRTGGNNIPGLFMQILLL